MAGASSPLLRTRRRAFGTPKPARSARHPRRSYRHRGHSAAFSPDDTRIVTARQTSPLASGTPRPGKPVAVLEGQNTGTMLRSKSEPFSPDGKRILTASGRRDSAHLGRRDRHAGAATALQGHTDTVWRQPPSAQTASASSPLLQTRQLVSGTPRPESPLLWLEGHDKAVTSRPPSARTASVSSQLPGTKQARIWDAETGKRLAVLLGPHQCGDEAAAFSPDDTRIVTAFRKTTLPALGRGDWVKTSCRPGWATPKQWTGRLPPSARTASASSPPPKTALPASGTQRAGSNSPSARRPLQESGLSAAFSPDGKRIVTASEDSTARVWDAATGQELPYLSGHTSWSTSATYSPDGKFIVTAGGDHTARIWDAATGQELRTLSGHSDWVNSAAFSPDGKFIVTASGDKTARIWDAAAPARNCIRSAATPPGSTQPPTAQTASSSSLPVLDGTARIWDAATGQELRTLSGHTRRRSAQPPYSPDGKFIVTAG